MGEQKVHGDDDCSGVNVADSEALQLGEKAVCESGSPCSDAPVTSTRRQQFEYSIAWVAVVL